VISLSSSKFFRPNSSTYEALTVKRAVEPFLTPCYELELEDHLNLFTYTV
jgi:hypothetical protein